MNFCYFIENKSTLKRTILVSIALVLALFATAQDYSNIEFIENKGQWNSRYRFAGEVSNGSFLIRQGGFTVVQHNPADLQNLANHSHLEALKLPPAERDAPVTVHSQAWDVDFQDADFSHQVYGEKPITTYNNYMIGNDPSKWASRCRIFQTVTFKNVYPNIDVRYYTDNGTLKYDIIVNPGGDISRIALKYTGVDKLSVENRQLVISTSIGERREAAPYSYQFINKIKKEISCKYNVTGNIVRFSLKQYDPAVTLIIDPSLIFCSFSGSTQDNWGYTATYGPDGSMYGGSLERGGGFPVSAGAFQTTFAGGNGATGDSGPSDIGLIKLSPDGSQRIWATYIGGSQNEQPHSLVVDPQGELVMAGRSNSPDYPVKGTTNYSGRGFDIVVSKLSADGTTLIGSQKIGGDEDDGVNIKYRRGGASSLEQNYGDDGRSEVILDGSGNVIVASCTQSRKFPVSSNAIQDTLDGGQDAVLIKFDPTVQNRIFSTYYGGRGDDAGYVLGIGPNGNIFMAGGTASDNLPGNHAGTFGPTYGGSIDGFIAEFTPNGATCVRSAYVGTAGIDQIYGMQFDRKGFLYVTGQTTGTWPIKNAVYNVPSGKQFIQKMEPDLSNVIYSTAFGTAGSANPNISPTAFLVDRCENVYVSGWGGDIGLNSYPSAGPRGLPVTPDAIKSTTADNADFYFFVMKRDATGLLYGSFFGQDGGEPDHVDGGTSRFDQNGVIYQGICANCKQGGAAVFPTTPGAWATANRSNGCNLAMVKIAFNLAGVGSDVQATIDGVRDTAGCLPLQVVFTDQVRNAESYIWDFGDGTPQVGPLPASTGYTQTHTYTSVGTFRVMLIAIDPASCNVMDTSYANVKVGDLKALVDFNVAKIGPCTAFQYQFNNLSLAPPARPFTDTSFSWNFGDGSPVIIAGTAPVTHTYPAPGTYNVILTLRDTAYCNYPEADTLQLRVDANVKAGFTTPATGCTPYNAVFTNTSVAGQDFVWDFGDGTTSTDFEPTHLYATAGTYTVTLTANNPNTCNLTDVATFTITVLDAPVADFSYTPTSPIANTPNVFTNLSSPDAVRYKWVWGDGDSVLTASRAPIEHQYNSTGTFNACLTAYNAAGCASTVCKTVDVIINPLLDVPNAFTPMSGDVNSKVMVRGFGIAKIKFTIWNRWGQKVFETENRLEGWDGRYKGQLQPMDVYAYTLSVEFFDGTKTTRKGDITLIR